MLSTTTNNWDVALFGWKERGTRSNLNMSENTKRWKLRIWAKKISRNWLKAKVSLSTRWIALTHVTQATHCWQLFSGVKDVSRLRTKFWAFSVRNNRNQTATALTLKLNRAFVENLHYPQRRQQTTRCPAMQVQASHVVKRYKHENTKTQNRQRNAFALLNDTAIVICI